MAELGKMKMFDLDELETHLGEKEILRFARDCEADFMKRLREIAFDAAWNEDLRVIFVSGPTSSGKTTFTQRLASALHSCGRKTVMLSMDDYYRPEVYVAAANGLPNFESIQNLDLEGMGSDLRLLLDGQVCRLPSFDLRLRRRVRDPNKTLRLPKNGLLLVEGLHGLHESLHARLRREEYFGVFIMPYACLLNAGCALNPEDERVLRRLSRDYHHRGANPLSTLDYWPVIHDSEKEVFDEYIARADVFMNSILPYEYFLIPGMAGGYLEADLKLYAEDALPTSVFVKHGRGFGDKKYADLEGTVAEAKRLLKICRSLPSIDARYVPEISLLNEFIR